MEWADGIANLITAITSAIGGAVAWAFARRDSRKPSKTEETAIDTVDAWERAMLQKNEQLAGLQADFDRAMRIIVEQEKGIARKDQRIAHLETLLDGRGGA